MSSAARRDRSKRPLASSASLRVESLEGRAVLAAAIAGVPDLIAANDSGWSATDNRTSVAAPTFSGVARNATSVTLFNGATTLGTVPVVNNAWSFSIDPAAALPAGRYSIVAQATNAENVLGRRSKPLVVEVITANPAAATVGLQAASDSGAKGDGVTNARTPVLAGVAPRGSRVILQIDGGSEVTLPTNPRTGAWAFKSPVLADGAHSVSVRSENVAGLRSEAATLSLRVDSVRPMAKLAFIAADNQIEVTFSRPVRGLSLSHFVVSGDLGGRQASLRLTNPNVVAATGGFVLEPKAGAVPGTVFRIRANNGDVFGGDYRITLSVPPQGIVETESGADNPLGPTTDAYGFNVRGNPYCNA